MNKTEKWQLGAAIGVVLTVIFLWGFPSTHSHLLGQGNNQTQAPAQTPSRVSVQNGEKVLTLDSETQSNLGLKVAALRPTSMREDLTAPAVVLDVSDLVAARTGYIEAQSRLAKARASAEVTRKEYDRAKALYQDRENVSQKAMQAAAGASRVDAEEVAAAGAELALQPEAVRQRWGDVVEKWVTDGGPTFDRLLAMQQLLVQVTLPAGHAATPPATTMLEIPGAGPTRASLVSPFPRVDPRLQGANFLYTLPAHPGLAPGVNLVAHLQVGRKIQGVVVPEAAVVWFQGKAWLYQQTGPTRFIRRAVTTEGPITDGFFVVQGFAPGDKVVVRGAQMLFSEETRPNVPSGGGDTD